MLSIVVPCYNEAGSLRFFHSALVETAWHLEEPAEVIYVDDGSADNTTGVALECAQGLLPTKVVQFSRNFGKEAALYAGMEHAEGDYVCLIDADLQQHPKHLSRMLTSLKRQDTYDVVAMSPSSKTKGGAYGFFRTVFHKVFKAISGLDLSHGASDFRMFTREVRDALLSVTECSRFTKGIFIWVGFDTLYLEYEPEERYAGCSSWSFWELLSYALNGIVSFSTTPLRIASFVGMFFCLVAFIYLVVTVIQTLFFGIEVPGYPSLIVSIMFFGGLQLFVLGVLGEYVAKAYEESKRRPIYISRKTLRNHRECEGEETPKREPPSRA